MLTAPRLRLQRVIVSVLVSVLAVTVAANWSPRMRVTQPLLRVISTVQPRVVQSWTAEPVAATPTGAQRGACAGGGLADPVVPPEPSAVLLAEHRGVATAMLQERVRSVRFCLFAGGQLLLVEDLPDATGGAQIGPVGERETCSVGRGGVVGPTAVGLTFVIGRTRSALGDVVVKPAHAPVTRAIARRGWFIAWWPTNEPATHSTLRRDALGGLGACARSTPGTRGRG